FPAPDALLLRAARRPDDREAAIRLLLLAGVSEGHVRTWCAEGDVWVLCDSIACPGECPLGAALVMPLGTGRTTELRLLAVAPAAWGCSANPARGGGPGPPADAGLGGHHLGFREPALRLLAVAGSVAAQQQLAHPELGPGHERRRPNLLVLGDGVGQMAFGVL